MKRYFLAYATLSAFLTVMLLMSSECPAQSRVIGASQTIADQNDEVSEFPNSTLSRKIRKYEAILEQDLFDELQGGDVFEDMVDSLKDLGVPITLDQSAMDDSLVMDEPLEGFEFQSGISGFDQISSYLRTRNATFGIRDNHFAVISMDVASDPEYFTTITYDITPLNQRADQVVEIIKEAIASDSWYDTNGDGVAIASDGGHGRWITISQEYMIHRQIRKHLASLMRLQGSSLVHSKQLRRPSFLGSTVIEVPGQEMAANRNRRGKRNSGVGGFGGGGGVFRVPSKSNDR